MFVNFFCGVAVFRTPPCPPLCFQDGLSCCHMVLGLLELTRCSFSSTLRGSNRYGRSPECSTGTTEFSTSLSYKFAKYESLSSDKLSSELLPPSRSSIDFSYGIPVAQCLCSTAYVTRDGYCFHRKWVFSR